MQGKSELKYSKPVEVNPLFSRQPALSKPFLIVLPLFAAFTSVKQTKKPKWTVF